MEDACCLFEGIDARPHAFHVEVHDEDEQHGLVEQEVFPQPQGDHWLQHGIHAHCHASEAPEVEEINLPVDFAVALLAAVEQKVAHTVSQCLEDPV